MQDSKLTTKQRKSLKSSTFCGPDRSFPVPDCKHVKAGLSLLGRYKGPGSKTAIKACIYRKAKKLGCFKTESAAHAYYSLIEAEHMYKDGQLNVSAIIDRITMITVVFGIERRIMSFALEQVSLGKTEIAIKIMRVALTEADIKEYRQN